MRLIFSLFLFLFLVVSCQNDKKQAATQTITSNPPNTTIDPQVDQLLKEPPSGVTLTNEQIEAAFAEKAKQLQPNANNSGNEPIELKGVNFQPEINEFMINKGQKVFDAKCTSCHNLTAKPYKASGLMGVTKKREPVWVMNFITGVPIDRLNVKGAEQTSLLKCYTRQEGQRLSIPEARDFLELMRHIDQ